MIRPPPTGTSAAATEIRSRRRRCALRRHADHCSRSMVLRPRWASFAARKDWSGSVFGRLVLLLCGLCSLLEAQVTSRPGAPLERDRELRQSQAPLQCDILIDSGVAGGVAFGGLLTRQL
jgi:hypothetical protein